MDNNKNFFMRHKIITGIIVLIILAAIGEAVGNNSPKKVGESKTASTSTQNKSDSESKSKTQTFKIGDVVQLKDYKVTVNKIRTGSGSDGMQPEQGKQYFYVDCTIENTSNEEKAISSVLMFKVQDQDGRSYDQAIPGDQNGQLDGKVSAGQKISGEYVVKVPEGKTGLRLVFDSSVLGTNGQVIVNLN
ncbi:hypothetical protein NL50_17305 [Clostridium acetobutylicum]|nr:hypothetical protein NL50_17305 [Clostridium acetobutylicum]